MDEIYSVEGDTAHIKIAGVLSPEGPDLWDRFFGYEGVAYGTIRAAMERARNDGAIARVTLDVDSPGGTLAGCDETWQAHKTLAAEKPTEVHAGNLLASAAYEISCPAHRILASGPSSRVGSIGVLVATYDWSKWEESVGIREVVITSSNAPDKRPDVSTEHGRETIKAQLDALERIFYDHVAESRGVTPGHIAQHFGRGGLLVAKDPSSEHEDAIRAGMIDGLTTDITQAAVEETDGTPVTLRQLMAVADAYPIFIKLQSGEPLTEAEVDELLSVEFPYLGDTNTPALAGKTQGEQAMDLSELLKANPAAAAEVEKLKSEARAAGAEEAKAEHSAKVDRVIGILTSKAYPDQVKALAGDVLAGRKGIDAFDAAVTLFDAGVEAARTAAAIEQTTELGAVGGEAPSLTPAAEKELDAAIQAELDRRKAKK